MSTFIENIITTFEVIECTGCGIKFGLPQNWLNEKRQNAGSFHCPNGCARAYKVSEAERLKKELEAKEIELRKTKCEVLSERNAREVVTALKEKAEKKLARVHKGVCPCCKRTFQNLQRHMATKHAEKIAG